MCFTKSSASLFTAILGLTLTANLAGGDFKAFDYETPAYVDLEYTEASVRESESLAITIIRTGDFRRTTTIEYQTVEEDASEGQDYKGAGGTLIFKPGEAYKTVIVEILADEWDEGSKTFRFELSTTDPYAMLMRSSMLITIEQPAVPSAGPTLQITSVGGGQILLSWEGSDTCALERTASPASGNWEQVECSPEVTANRCEVVQPVGGTHYFYRLRVD